MTAGVLSAEADYTWAHFPDQPDLSAPGPGFAARGARRGAVLRGAPAAGSNQSSEVFSTARKADWGSSTSPTIFIRFLPSFCFSSSLRLRVMSPP